MTTGPAIVVGITGASGAAYGVRLLERLGELGAETHLVVTPAGVLNAHHELGLARDALAAKAARCHAIGDIAACIASGSFDAQAMVVAPCSMKSLAAIAHGFGDNLLTRAADVMLKERRPLVLMIRETPLHLGHLRTMTALAEIGAIIAPPVPALYANPKSVEELIDQSVARVFDLLGFEAPTTKRWGEDLTQGRRRPQGGASTLKTPKR